MQDNSIRTVVGQPTPGETGIARGHSRSELNAFDSFAYIKDKEEDAIQTTGEESGGNSGSSEVGLTAGKRSLAQPVPDEPEQRHPFWTDPWGLGEKRNQPGFGNGDPVVN